MRHTAIANQVARRGWPLRIAIALIGIDLPLEAGSAT
jgi:hypothetical protein